MTLLQTLSTRSVLLTGALAIAMVLGVLFGSEALAQDTTSAREGLTAAGGNSATGAQNDLSSIIGTIVNILSIIVGALSVIMIIIGGLRYVVSGGDSGGIQSAKNTIVYAIVGLIIVLFAQIIVNFVITEVEDNRDGTNNNTTSLLQPLA